MSGKPFSSESLDCESPEDLLSAALREDSADASLRYDLRELLSGFFEEYGGARKFGQDMAITQKAAESTHAQQAGHKLIVQVLGRLNETDPSHHAGDFATPEACEDYLREALKHVKSV